MRLSRADQWIMYYRRYGLADILGRFVSSLMDSKMGSNNIRYNQRAILEWAQRLFGLEMPARL